MALVTVTRGIGYFPSYIRQRIERNKNFLAVITGQTGSGKSLSALRLAESLDPEFDIRNVCFTPQEFMNLVKGNTKTLKRGSVIVWDELQVTMSNMDFQSLQAKIINFVLQTFRYRGFILFVTAPHFSFINAGARKLFHSRIETVKIDKNKKLCYLKPLLLQTSQDTGDIYRKYLRVKVDGKIIPLTEMKVGLPSEELLKAYEHKKDSFTNDLYNDISADLLELESNSRNKPPSEQQEKILNLMVEGKIIPDISKELGISERLIYDQIRLIKKKGIDVKPIKENKKVIRYDIDGYNKAL
jgi:hypothetical protein